MSTVITCPCCGGYMAKPISLDDLREIHLTSTERVILRELINRYPRSVSIDELTERTLSGRRDGGPESGRRMIHVYISRIRRKLTDVKWTLTGGQGGRGNYGQYRLTKGLGQ